MALTLTDIIKERNFLDTDRELLRKFYRGRICDVQPIVFPRYDWLTPEKHEILSHFFAYVNLLKPAVNRIVSGVYGGAVSRAVSNGSPYKKQVDEFLQENKGYSLKCRDWFKSGVMYGTGVNVFTVHNDKVSIWQPNPIYTEIVSNPDDVTDIEWIVEARYDRPKTTKRKIAKVPQHIGYRFVNKEGWGVADLQGNFTHFVPHGLGIVPAVVSYGENNHLYDEDDGDSLVLSGIQYSMVVSRLLLNQVALIMNFVRPQAVSKGKVLNPEEAFDVDGIAEMEIGGDFLFVTPQTNFKDLTATIETYKVNYCISEGVPLDALDPSNIPENQSATSARLRNQPLSVTINRLIQEQTSAEAKALTIIGALFQLIDTKNSVDYADFSTRFQPVVTIKPSGTPESHAEVAAAWAQLLAMGAKTVEDVIREFNPGLSEADIQVRIKDFKAAADAAAKAEADASQNAGSVDSESEKDAA